MTCFTWLLVVIAGVLLIMSVVRWFDMATDAVREGSWKKVAALVGFPFSVWFYPGRVSAGRPTMVPPHEPVRGFGELPRDAEAAEGASQRVEEVDQPPPGTPKEFLGMPVVPPKKPVAQSRAEADAAKVEKLRQKMREQGML